MPKVSVIIPSYNYAQYLPECLKSIFGQNSADWEAIIVDDGSSDNTPEVGRTLVSVDPKRVKYFRTENKGVTHARNFGIENSSGEYILPLDADDLLAPNAIREFAGCLDNNPQAGFAYSALENFGKDNSIWEPGPYNQQRLIWENLAACTSMWRKTLFSQGVHYRKVIFEDWDLWLQIAAKGFEGRYIPQALFKYRIHHQGRNTINKNRYMQSLIEEIKLNPGLYNENLLAWAEGSSINFPGCFEKPSIVFLPEPGSKEFSEFSGPLAKLAGEYVAKGHFVASVGDYKNSGSFQPGVVLMSFINQNNINEEVKHEVYKLGKEVIVYNGHGAGLNDYIKSVNNVTKVLTLNIENLADEPLIEVNTDYPKISVVTVSYNQAEFIKENIESVLAQNYPNFEHLIIDGGSTDGTVEILKSYPHLNWVSEPDRGQTHALNKGFKKASGEIICWLNSDDYYPKNVFHEIAERLKNNSIVIGACQVTGREGEEKEYVPNVARSWFDVLKYWIFFSSPAQPSIFFKKEVLEDFALKDGSYLDEGLDFCMDYEFWLRIGKKYPLASYIPKVLSYCRTYDTNKTGRDMDSVYREMSRVFSRYAKVSSSSERALSFVIPVTNTDKNLFETLESISTQNLADYEILVIDHSSDPKAAKVNRRAILDFEKTLPFVNVRYLRSLNENYIAAVNQAVEAACAEYIALIAPGTRISPSFCFDVKNLFRHDIIAMALPLKDQAGLSALVKKDDRGPARVNLDNIFACPWIAPCFVARKVALQEIGGIKELKTDYFIVNSLIMNFMNKGWQVSVENNLQLNIPTSADQDVKNKKVAELSGYFAAKIITQIYEDEDEFTKLRIKNGFGLSFSEEIIKSSKMVTEQTKDQITF